MSFCTAISCLDGRVQLPVIQYLQKRFKASYVDLITEAGVNLILSKQDNAGLVQSILEKVRISIEEHNSLGVGIVGHHDCFGNPASKDRQMTHIQNATQFIKKKHKKVEIIGLWVNKDLKVHELF